MKRKVIAMNQSFEHRNFASLKMNLIIMKKRENK